MVKQTVHVVLRARPSDGLPKQLSFGSKVPLQLRMAMCITIRGMRSIIPMHATSATAGCDLCRSTCGREGAAVRGVLCCPLAGADVAVASSMIADIPVQLVAEHQMLLPAVQV